MAYEDRRVRLTTPDEIQKNDRLQRNGDEIVNHFDDGENIVVETRNGQIPLPKSQPVRVWRLTF